MSDWFEEYMKKPATVENVKKALIECYVSVQKQAYGGKLPEEITEDFLVNQLKCVFHSKGVDFDNPSKQDLLRIINELRGTLCCIAGEEKANEHYEKMKKLIERLPE